MIKKDNNKKISSFTGKNRFLSNFYAVPVTIDGITYQNSEAAFQAQKCRSLKEKMKFASYKNPITAKRNGNKVTGLNVAWWNDNRLRIMKKVCLAKFDQNPDLKEKLLATRDAELIEGNSWGDTFWGVDSKSGIGRNELGKILMQVREEFKGL